MIATRRSRKPREPEPTGPFANWVPCLALTQGRYPGYLHRGLLNTVALAVESGLADLEHLPPELVLVLVFYLHHVSPAHPILASLSPSRLRELFFEPENGPPLKLWQELVESLDSRRLLAFFAELNRGCGIGWQELVAQRERVVRQRRRVQEPEVRTRTRVRARIRSRG